MPLSALALAPASVPAEAPIRASSKLAARPSGGDRRFVATRPWPQRARHRAGAGAMAAGVVGLAIG